VGGEKTRKNLVKRRSKVIAVPMLSKSEGSPHQGRSESHSLKRGPIALKNQKGGKGKLGKKELSVNEDKSHGAVTDPPGGEREWAQRRRTKRTECR